MIIFFFIIKTNHGHFLLWLQSYIDIFLHWWVTFFFVLWVITWIFFIMSYIVIKEINKVVRGITNVVRLSLKLVNRRRVLLRRVESVGNFFLNLLKKRWMNPVFFYYKKKIEKKIQSLCKNVSLNLYSYNYVIKLLFHNIIFLLFNLIENTFFSSKIQKKNEVILLWV